MGIQTVIGHVPKMYETKRIELVAEKLIPAVADLEPAPAGSR
jgi:hypothetical protein